MRREQSDDFARPAYEFIPACAWAISSIVYVAIGRHFDAAIAAIGLLSLPTGLLALYRLNQAVRIWNFKVRLTSPSQVFYAAGFVLAKAKRFKGIYLGKGFQWEPIHAKRMRTLAGMDSEDIQPPKLYLGLSRLLGFAEKPYGTDGFHSVHGVGNGERDIVVGDDAVRGHTYIVGTTGAGKTKTFEMLIAQAISRGGPVIVFDPKGDADLRDRCYAEAARQQRSASFRFFSLSHPNQSIFIDPLSTYARPSNIANRIASLLPAGGNATAFRDFAWRAINVVVDALIEAGEEISLLSLRRYIEGDVDSLVVASTEAHCRKAALSNPSLADWDNQVDQIERKTKVNTSSPNWRQARRAAAISAFYINVVKPLCPNRSIDNMVSVMMHDRVHYSKLISNLIPLLEQLTSGPLARLLASASEHDDGRVTFTFDHLIKQNAIVYINLDTLADGIVGQAVGSLFLADLTSVAAARYASAQDSHSLDPVAVFVDETAELINDAFIQNLNKGRGAGFQLTIASQTVADFVAKFGDQAMAMQTLGNTNMTIALRVKDPDTRKFVVSLMGQTHKVETTEGRMSSTIDPTDSLDFKGQVVKSGQISELDMVSEDTLNKLPNLHYFAMLPGGRIHKGRTPIMPFTDAERFVVRDCVQSTPVVPRAVRVSRQSDVIREVSHKPDSLPGDTAVSDDLDGAAPPSEPLSPVCLSPWPRHHTFETYLDFLRRTLDAEPVLEMSDDAT